ncbi:MAG: hypothetical protein OEY86_17800, partial [Nitrospira sp.]|nr:hypothetical protein [Nitrospira sp.]
MYRLSHHVSAVWFACFTLVLSVVLSSCGVGQPITVAGNTDAPPVDESPVAEDTTEVTQEEPSDMAVVVPKRDSADPIFVNLAPPVLDTKTRKAEKPKGAIARQLRNEFAADPIIQLIPDPTNAKRAKKRTTSQVPPPSPDVEVASTVSVQEVLGINAKTGKPKKTLNIVFEA